MKCPTDQATLVMSERSGIEIDYCPDCRGVWLDRGELDKILERAGETSSAAPTASAPPTPSSPAPNFSGGFGGRDDRDRRDDRDYRGGYDSRQPRKRKESWLSELFD